MRLGEITDKNCSNSHNLRVVIPSLLIWFGWFV